MSPSNKNQLQKIAKDIHVLKETSGSAYTPELIDIIVRENENQIIITTIIEHTHLDLKTALLKPPYADLAEQLLLMVAQGLNHIHQLEIIHYSLHDSKIIIKPFHQNVPKKNLIMISNFENAIIQEDNKESEFYNNGTSLNSQDYSNNILPAPEMLFDKPYKPDFPADIWSLGVIFSNVG